MMATPKKEIGRRPMRRSRLIKGVKPVDYSGWVQWRALFDVCAIKAGVIKSIAKFPDKRYPTESELREYWKSGKTVMDAICLHYKLPNLKGKL